MDISVLSTICNIPVLFLIITVGIILSIRSKMAQIRYLPAAFRQLIRNLSERKSADNTVSAYRALCTALAATVGTGNIAGVAGAIALGGPGAVFWIWVCALLGMIIKFAEVSLAVHYREKISDGSYTGGTMYMIKNGLPPKLHFLAPVYCFFGIIAALGVGNATQINAVCDGIKNIAFTAGIPLGKEATWFLGLVIAIAIIPIFRNGATGIGALAEQLVPFAAVMYILLSILALLIRADYLKDAFYLIIQGAFSPSAVTGGMVGSTVIALRVGISRGIFTNEAGMGTASIAHSSSNSERPFDQGLMGIMEVFLDTVVICTLTAMVILTSGIEIPYGTDLGMMLTLDAFANVLGNWSRVLLSVLSCIFAFATILGWGLYGIRFCQYLFGIDAWKGFIIAQVCAVLLGAILQTSIVWQISEIVNSLMALPNLLAIFMLLGVFLSDLRRDGKKEYSYK